MYSSVQKLFLFFFILSSAFVVASVFNTNEVRAGWTCCTATTQNCGGYSSCASTDCGKKPANTCPNGCCNYELKNPGTNQGVNECETGTVSNACGDPGSGGSGGLTCSLRALPGGVVTLTPGATIGLNAEFGANQSTGYNGWGRYVSYVIPNTSVASASPVNTGGVRINNVWPPINTTITGVTVGSTIVNLKGKIQPISGTAATCNTANTINVVASKQCYPGANCTVVGGGNLASGKYVSCTVPAVPADVATGFTTNYDLKCDIFRGTSKLRTATSQLNRTTTTFTSFTVGSVANGDVLKCSFRYCLKKTGQVLCSDWGSAS